MKKFVVRRAVAQKQQRAIAEALAAHAGHRFEKGQLVLRQPLVSIE